MQKKFYWMSSRISIGRPLESTGCPVELLYRTSPRAEDLAHYFLDSHNTINEKLCIDRSSRSPAIAFWKLKLVGLTIRNI